MKDISRIFLEISSKKGNTNADQAILKEKNEKIESFLNKYIEFLSVNLQAEFNRISCTPLGQLKTNEVGTKIKDIIEEGSLYKMTVVLSTGQEVVSYTTKDGKKFFPQVLETEEEEDAGAEEQSKTPPVNNIPKNDKPVVELFVMSHCPYGTQIEKGILPVLDILGDKIDFELKFVDYVMHGEEEIDEQLNQYCIQKEQGDKLLGYLECFLADGDGESCLGSSSINISKMNSCVSKTDKDLEIKEKFADRSTWSGGKYPTFDTSKADNEKYGVAGSPTLIVNGVKASSGRDAASLLTTICSGFNNPPSECGEVLSSSSPSAGFGFGTSDSSNSAASCN